MVGSGHAGSFCSELTFTDIIDTMGKTWKDQKKWERKKSQRDEDTLKENRREPRRPHEREDEVDLDDLDNIWDE